MMMKIKRNYIIIPLITAAVAIIGNFLTTSGMPWYDLEVIKSALTPSKWVFSIVWITIYILTTISVLIVWNKGPVEDRYLMIFKKKTFDFIFVYTMGLFILSTILNVLWYLIFFIFNQIFFAILEMAILELTILILIAIIWKRSKIASLLLTPYAIWIGFATYLTVQIALLN